MVPGPKVGESYSILYKCPMVIFLFTPSLNSLTSPGQSLKTVVGLPNLAGSPKHGAIQSLGMSGNFAELLAQAFCEDMNPAGETMKLERKGG